MLLPAAHENTCVSTSLPVLAFVGLLCLKSYFIVILICSSTVNYEVEHIFMYIFICIGHSCFLFTDTPVYVFCIFPVLFVSYSLRFFTYSG